MKLEFRLLGDLAVFADGHPLELGGTRQRSVLALLLLQGDRAIATDMLADRLWGDEQPASAIKTIQVYVARIRHALGPDADRLVSSATGYRLSVSDDELDAARFQRGLRQAREALAAGSHEAARAMYEEILALWSGPALGDLVGEPFARREADRLEELRLQSLEELYELRIATGSARDVTGEIRRLLTDQPGRERLWRLLMLALYADDRQGEALEAYQDARRYLADELGVDPSPALQELERAVLRQEAPRPRQAGVPAGAIARGNAVATQAGQAELPTRQTRRVVTVLRVDAVRTSDHDLLDPENIEALERHVLEMVRRAVERHGGTIDRTDHDGVTGVFGLTVAREDDALRAVRAAAELREGAKPRHDGEPALRLGVATGEVLAGSGDARGSMLTGSTVRMAVRLAAQATVGEVLLAPATLGLVRGATSTERASPESGDDENMSSAHRLLTLTGGEAIVRRTTTQFVGRTAELEALLAAFERVVLAGSPGLVTVMGAPGVGKSRLVAEALARISKRARILRSRCLPYGDGITYWPIRELVLSASGIAPTDPADEALGKLQTLLEGSDRAEIVSNHIAGIVGFADDPIPSEEIPWAVRRMFEVLAAERPLVLLVDDLQWAEPKLVDLLDHILDLGRGPILIVTIARPELEDTRLEWLARSNLSLLRLDALGDSDATALLDLLAPELPQGQLRSRILTAAEGNPLFVQQYVAYVSDEAGADWRSLDQRTEAELPIPPTIAALLAARLDRLPDVERRLLERASVAGRAFSADAVSELLPERERTELQQRLAHLSRRDLIRRERSELPDDDAYRFRHLLIRDAAYASLPKSERAELHERFADWLEHRAEEATRYDLILGYHLEQAYRYRLELGDNGPGARQIASRALAYIAPGGLAAEARGDPRAAISLLRRAIDLRPSTHQRIELLIALRSALWLAGERQASSAADSETAALLAEEPDEGLQHRRSLALAMYDAGQSTAAEALAAYEYYERVGDQLGMIHALEVAMMHPERVSVAVEQLDQAVALAFAIGRPDRATTVSARSAYMFPYGSIPVSDSLARLRRYLGWAANNRFAQASILLHLGELEAMSGVRDRWRRHFEEAKGIIDDLGLVMPFGVFGYPVFLGTTELAAGDPARVVDMLLECCSTLDRLGELPRLASVAPLTARALLAVGRLDEAEQFASWGRDIAAADDLDAQVRWRLAISGLRSLQGRHDEAIRLARESTALLIDESTALLIDGESPVLLGEVYLRLAEALRTSGDEPAALVAAHEARRLALAKENRAALRKIDAFLA